MELAPSYWTTVFLKQLGVKSRRALKHVRSESYPHLVRFARTVQEKKALRKLLKMEGEESTFQEEREWQRKSIEMRQKHSEQVLQELRRLKKYGKYRYDEEAQQLENAIRENLQISPEFWLCKTANLKQVICELSAFHTIVSEELQAKEISDVSVLEKASGGRALRGILITKNVHDQIQERDSLLKVPGDIRLMAPSHSQHHKIKQFTSRRQEKEFTDIVNILGFTVATCEKVACSGATLELFSSHGHTTEEDDLGKSETYSSTVQYFVLPLASWCFNDSQFKLTDKAVKDLQGIEELIDSCDKSLQTRCEQFFNKYGSHVNKGPLHFGGTYQWILQSSGFKHVHTAAIQQLQSDIINGMLMSQSPEDSAIFCSLDGKNPDTLSRPVLVITKSGWAQEHAVDLPGWKNGLVANNRRWCLIDRGTTLVPVWDVIQKNHCNTNDFKKPYSLAILMREAWKTMTQFYSKDDKEDPVGDIQEVIRAISTWNEHPDMSSCKEQLHLLAERKQIIGKVSMNPHIWPNVYLSQPPLQTFFKLIVDNFIKHNSEECTLAAEIKVAMKEVIDPLDLDTVKVFPCRKHVSRWVYSTESLTVPMDYNTILSLQRYFQCALDHMFGSFLDSDFNVMKTAMQPDISICVTTALAKVVHCFTNQLQKAGQKYEEAFIITMLLPFNYDPNCHTFLTLLSACDLNFLCKEYECHFVDFYETMKQQIDIRSQIHLFLLAVKLHKTLCTHSIHMESHLRCLEQMIGDQIDPQIADILLKLPAKHYDWTWLQTQLGTVLGGLTDDSNSTLPIFFQRKQENEEFLSMLGLTHLYPQKLTLYHAVEIREDTLECVKGTNGDLTSGWQRKKNSSQCTDPKLYPFLILQKVMAFDYKCRIKLVCSASICSSSIKKTSVKRSDRQGEARYAFHPLDGLLAVILCADDFLRQDLMSRLTACQLAVPFLIPDPIVMDKLTLPIWAMRSIVKEWKNLHNGKSQEGQLISYPAPIVSFLRIGTLTKSKSHLINTIVSESGHNVFFHFHCDGGNAMKLLANGMVELCWYLPSKSDSTFPDVTAFANLHGDALNCSKQVKFLSMISFMNFVLVKENNVDDEALEVLRSLAAAPGGLVLLQVESSSDEESFTCFNSLKQSIPEDKLHVIQLDENDADIADEICKEINLNLTEKWKAKCSLEECCDAARTCKIIVDEDAKDCLKGKELATVFKNIIGEFIRAQNALRLKDLLPLQGCELWHKWAASDKEQYRQANRGQCSIEHYGADQREKMSKIRREQLDRSQLLHPLMESFLSTLLRYQGKTRQYFLQWIRFTLDSLSREQLPMLHSQYKQKRAELLSIQSEKKKDEEKACKSEIEELNLRLIHASFGLEHLLREISQIYEAQATRDTLPNTRVSCLPEVAAELMIEGYPLELMDGDAAHVPISWVSAVMTKLQEILGTSRLFVLSVLGLQSTGKSTLMNTVFGLQFSVSAGRCTRGAFMQLIPIHHSLQQKCSCDYFLIVDTEGLRAPELDALQTQKHDNELATFVIGLANLTLTNLYGETAGDLEDILQTAVHAFLRMKMVRLKPSCHFVHQNVATLMAGEKGMMGRFKFKDNLDTITQAAAKAERMDLHCKRFSDVIDFNEETDVSHFPPLWKGDPPRAPINPGYSANAQVLKSRLITVAKSSNHTTNLEMFSQQITQLWEAILKENFVFSFKNTLEISAYNTLECEYCQWSWYFKKEMMDWEQIAQNKIRSCEYIKLHAVNRELRDQLPGYVQAIHQKLSKAMCEFFEESSQHDILVKWRAEMEIRLESLRKQLQAHAYDQCMYWKCNREALAEVDQMKVTYRGRILEQVKHIVSKLEKGKLDEQQLAKEFNKLWCKCIEELKSVTIQPVEINVERDVENCLLDFELLRSAKPVLHERLRDSPLRTWGYPLLLKVKEAHLKPLPQYWRTLVIPIFLGWNVTPEHLKCAQEITDRLLEDQMAHIKRRTNENYNPSLTTEVLCKLFEGINSHKDDVSFTEEYEVDMALSVCGYALKEFKKMVEIARKKNDPVEYLEREMKEPLFNIFKDEYNQIDAEITAASAVCGLLMCSVRKEVIKSLSTAIVASMKTDYVFLKTKSALKAKILLDIGDALHAKGDSQFEPCWLYLRNVELSLRSWILQYTHQYCSEGTPSRLAIFANAEISDIVTIMTKAVDGVTEADEGEFKIKEWLAKFHCELHKSGKLQLDVEELCQLGGVHQLKNVSFFTDEVKRGLENLQYTLKQEFEKMGVTEMKCWEQKPYDILYEDISGCTEQCPFCKEQCDHTIANHSPSTKHSVAMHRPSCLGGYRWNTSAKMVLDICTSLVGSDLKFRNYQTMSEYHPYRNYNTIYPEWVIPDDKSLEVSFYWKWLVAHYTRKITEKFDMCETNIPSEWKSLKWKNVQRNLKDKYRL